MIKHGKKFPLSHQYVFTALILSQVWFFFLAHLQKFSSSHFSDPLYFPNACLIYTEQFWGGKKKRKESQVHMPQMINLRQKILVKEGGRKERRVLVIWQGEKN